MKNVTIYTTKINAGRFKIEVYEGHSLKGTFETTDMQLVDDISEMNNDGYESELIMHDTFSEVETTCLNKIK